MMNWLYYLLEANLYLIIFYGFYRLFLHKETFYELNRYYLLFSSILVFILPFFQLGFLKNNDAIENLTVVEQSYQFKLPSTNQIIEVQQSVFTWQNILAGVYIAVVVFFFLKLIIGLGRIILMKIKSTVYTENGINFIDIKGSKLSFSFFNLLFIDSQLSGKNTILKHELVHIKQLHSLDIIFFELIQIINWFNPIPYFLKKDVKLVHEYLADEETTRVEIDKYQYALFLIQHSAGIQNLSITNQIFNSSFLKKRINMLNQKKSGRWARLKLLLVLPITAGILCISTMAFTKDFGLVELGFSLKLQSTKLDTVKKAFDSNDGIHVPNPNELYLALRVDPKTKKPTTYTKKLIFINGKEIKAGTSGGVKNIKYMIRLNPVTSKAKYGERGSYGAIEIFSSDPEIISPPTEVKLPKNSSQKIIILSPPPPIGKKINDKEKSNEVILKGYQGAIGDGTVKRSSTNNKDKTFKLSTTPESDNNSSKVEEKKGLRLVLEMNQDEIIKSNNDRLFVNIPVGAEAELTVYNSTYDKAFYQSTNYKNDWYAKELPDGKYPYNFVFRNNGKVVGGKSGFVDIK